VSGQTNERQAVCSPGTCWTVFGCFHYRSYFNTEPAVNTAYLWTAYKGSRHHGAAVFVLTALSRNTTFNIVSAVSHPCHKYTSWWPPKSLQANAKYYSFQSVTPHSLPHYAPLFMLSHVTNCGLKGNRATLQYSEYQLISIDDIGTSLNSNIDSEYRYNAKYLRSILLSIYLQVLKNRKRFHQRNFQKTSHLVVMNKDTA
jgi:hypothetical protein